MRKRCGQKANTIFCAEFPLMALTQIHANLSHLREGMHRCQPLCPTGPGFLSEMTSFVSATKLLSLDVKFLNIQGMLLDELSAGFDLVAHEDSKDLIRCSGIFHFDLKKNSFFRVHTRVPEFF